MQQLKHSLLICFVYYLSVNTLFIGILGGRAQADDKTRELAVYLPDSVNTISILRLKKSSATQEIQNNKWTKVLSDHFGDERAGFLTWGDTLLIGSLFHPSVPEEAWATGVMHLPKQISFNAIAKEQNSSIDSLAQRPVVRSATGSYLVKFPSDVIGMYRPGLRQDAATWITSATKKKSITVKPYLRRAIDKQGDVVLAINLEHLLDPQFVKSKIEEDERFVKHKKLIDQLVPLISGLRGVTLTATTDEVTECEISMDFSDDVKRFTSVMKTLFLSVLEDAGAMIDEFPSAKVRATGNSVTLQCQLSEESLHRILSLVSSMSASTNSHSENKQHAVKLPPVSTTKTKDKNNTGPTDKQRATKRYFESVSKKIANLQRANRNAKNYKNTIAWHENFARTIENLPTKNVDREFLTFGQRTTKRFRALASSLRGQEVKVNLQEKTLTYQTDYDPGWASANWWGGAGYRPPSVKVRSNLKDVREAVADVELKGYEERKKIWQLLLEDEKGMQSQLEKVR